MCGHYAGPADSHSPWCCTHASFLVTLAVHALPNQAQADSMKLHMLFTQVLAKKMIAIMELSQQQLSKQDHYDYGLRSFVIPIARAAGKHVSLAKLLYAHYTCLCSRVHILKLVTSIYKTPAANCCMSSSDPFHQVLEQPQTALHSMAKTWQSVGTCCDPVILVLFLVCVV